MHIIKEPTFRYKYGFISPYSIETLDFCRSLKNKYGYNNFGYEDRKWRFNDLAFVNIIIERFPEVSIDDNLLKDIKNYRIWHGKKLERIKRAEELKKATASNIEIPNFRGELYPYQKIGVEFFINNRGKAILADVMGLGKSATALAYILYANIKRSLVICPASVKYSWENEVKKWTDLKPFVIDSKTNYSDIDPEKFDIFIINYDILKKFYHSLLCARFDCIIIDEFHYIKNIRAQRTKLARAIAKACSSILLLSGTPLLSRPVELYNGLNLIDPINWNNWRDYTIRYCNGRQGYFGWEAIGASNIPELKSIINHYLLRRTKNDVLKELPPKRFITYPVKLDNGAWKEYRLAEKDFIRYLCETKKRKLFDSEVLALKLSKINSLRQISANGKIGVAREIIEEIVNSGEKLIVYSAYNAPLKKLHKTFKDISVLLIGSTPIEERKDIINEFQNNPNIKIFFGGIKSAGIGITLTAASNVLFIDYSWVPADHHQCIDRCHRIGQVAESITVYQLFAKKTIDEKMKQILSKKQKLFDQLIESKDFSSVGNVNIIRNVIKLFELESEKKHLTSEKLRV